jgi:hypothetical protein
MTEFLMRDPDVANHGVIRVVVANIVAAMRKTNLLSDDFLPPLIALNVLVSIAPWAKAVRLRGRHKCSHAADMCVCVV